MSPVIRATLRIPLLAFLLLALACGPSDPLEEIRELHSTGKFTETLAPLRKIVDKDPSQTEALLLLGTALLRTGSGGLAVWPLRKAAQATEFRVVAGMLLTEAMIEGRTAPDAVEEIDLVLAIEPNNLDALMLRVEANKAAANHEDVLGDIDRVLEQDPTNLPVLVTRVTTLITLNRIEEANAALDVAQLNFDADEGTIAVGMLARLCVARALFAFENGDHETADAHFADCAERFPTERVAVAAIVSYYDRTGRFKRATQILERASAEAKNSGVFRTQLARRHGAMGNIDVEERILREEAESRETAIAWFVLADHYVSRDLYDKAIVAFEEAVAITPGAPRLRFAYADTLVQANEFKKAREAISRLDQSELRNLVLGRILLGEGNARGALKAFEAGIKLWPNNAVGRFLAGQAAERVGNFPRAISHYRESFRTDPGGTDAGHALAELYASQGVTNDALQIANRYINAHASDPDAYLLSVRLAHSVGRRKIVTEGLQRLSQMPGQAAVASAEEATLLALDGKATEAVQAVEATGLDLTDPSNAIALRVLIEQLGMLEQHEKAAGLIDLSLAAHPDKAVFFELQGSALSTEGKADRARASYERALEMESTNWRALSGLAALTEKAGDSTKALALYDRAIVASPEDPGPALAAIALVREQDPEDTVSRLVRFLDLHPRTASAANELAGLLADRGELNRATSYASRAAWFRLPEAKETVERIEKLRAAAAPASASEDESTE